MTEMTLLNQLERALTIYVGWKSSGDDSSFEQLVAEHPDVEELLQAFHAEQIEDLVMPATTSADAGEAPDARMLGPYRLGEEIGRGGMGVVFEATHRETGAIVALKVLREHLTRETRAVVRFLKEAKLASGLDHPGIVRVHHVGREGETYFFAMDRVPGRSLSAILHDVADHDPAELSGADFAQTLDGRGEFWQRPFVEIAVDLAVQVGEALAYAHDRHVLHRDVKPSNILVAADGQAYLTDFGLARDEQLPSQTRTGEFAGSPYYVSPEQAMAKRVPVDQRTDVFSLGATLYELLSLQKAFPGTSAPEVLAKIISKTPVDLRRFHSGLHPDLVSITFKALEKDRDRRYSSVGLFVNDLRAFRRDQPVAAPTFHAARRFLRWAAHNRVVAALGATLLVVGLSSVGVLVNYAIELEARHVEVTSLSDRNRLEALNAAKHVTASFSKDHVPALAEWMRKAEELVARREVHRERLERLRGNALPYSDADREHDRQQARWYQSYRRDKSELEARLAAKHVGARLAKNQKEIAAVRKRLANHKKRIVSRKTWRFADDELSWEHEQLSLLVRELDQFTARGGMHGVVARWLQHARTVEQRSLVAPAAKWKEAITAIAASPKYSGLEIRPQLGLVPIGFDPKSGLYEFAHLQTGEIPERKADGVLDYRGNHGLVFVLLPGGTTTIGARRPRRGEADRTEYRDRQARLGEGSPREVVLEPFFLSKFEMTQGQWYRFSAEGPSKDYRESGWRMLPVETIHWMETTQFLRAMGLLLPTGAQWEYAARAGTSTPWFVGSDPRQLEGVVNGFDQALVRVQRNDPRMAMKHDDGFPYTAPVGSYRPNAFGLHDALGNVEEWVRDLKRILGQAPKGGEGSLSEPVFNAVIRGGCFLSMPGMLRVTAVTHMDIWSRIKEIGVRPARALDR